MGGSPPPPPLPPPVKVEPATPMASPEAGPTNNSDTAAGLRKAKGRNGLKVDLTADLGTGLNIPI